MNIDEIKRRIDLPELARYLNVKKAKGGKTSWHAPGRDDKSASLSIYQDARSREWRFKDHAGGPGSKGSAVDFVMYVNGCDFKGALELLHQFLGVPMDAPKREEPREKSLAEHIAARCMDKPEAVIQYLVDERRIPESIVKRAIAHGTVGYNQWTSTKAAAGEVGYGGPAAAFIVRSPNPGHVVAVDLRYLDPKLNGDVKTMTQGEKAGFFWSSDWKRVEDAHTVYVTEGAIDAMTVEAGELPYTAAIAIRGTALVDSAPWRLLQGKQVVMCMSNDPPRPAGDRMAGLSPGAVAAWRAHEVLTEMDISCLLVDQLDWDAKDINELAQKHRMDGGERLRGALRKLEAWLIPGRPPSVEVKDPDDAPRRKSRVFLPWQDDSRYWGFRVRPDFTSRVKEVEVNDGDGDSKTTKLEYSDLAGFRIAALSRVTIASPTSTMTGDPDAQPTVMFSVSVQAPRHGAKLLRRVVEDEKLHNVDMWKKFGPVFAPNPFLRMVNILERTAHLGARNVINFVGVAWRDGRLVVNEGPNCYFVDPRQQCPYWRLTFPSGSPPDARRVIAAYQRTFAGNAGSLVLVWALGAHLKALLGFWPHMEMQASKGSGKSTFTKHLERTIAMTMFSGESIQTGFRILASLSHTSHPVGWEELSARKQETIQYAVRMLQEAYQYTTTQRSAEMKEFLVSAPVLLAGEDVPAKELVGKMVRTQLKVKGEMLANSLPRFPVRQWLEFITSLSRTQVASHYDRCRKDMLEISRASGKDAGALRMAGNYAALRMAWELLCEFSGIDPNEGKFREDLVAGMNAHVGETSADRHPWVWITEKLIDEIAKRNFQYPHTFDTVDPPPGVDAEPEECLLVRTSHVMAHMSSTSSLRDFWNGLTVKSDRTYKSQLKDAGVVVRDDIERAIGGTEFHGQVSGGRRVAHMTALSIARLQDFGLDPVRPAGDAEPPGDHRR